MIARNQSIDTLPVAYKVLPHSLDFRVPHFSRCYRPGDRVLAVQPVDTTKWFHHFVDRVVEALGREHLPVCRMSDGEFDFLFGPQPTDLRYSKPRKWTGWLRRKLKGIGSKRDFEAGAIGHYHSGRYSRTEQAAAKQNYAAQTRAIAKDGILALHLSYGVQPFQEAYFPALGSWLDRNGIAITDGNYVPFYFVYAALTGPRRKELLVGKRILVVNGAGREKKKQIVEGLRHEGVAEVAWLDISAERSLFDIIDVRPWQGRVDLVLVGAGIGKPNILCQLAQLSVPCIDAGFVFEVWADANNRYERPFCAPDGE